MNFPFRSALSLIVANFLALPCLASGLNWEVRERQVNTTAGGENVVVKFPFVNSGAATQISDEELDRFIEQLASVWKPA